METLLPDGWPRPSGFSAGLKARGELIFVAGHTASQSTGDQGPKIQSDVFSDQVKCALENVVAVLRSGGAGPEHVTRMTWYVTDVEEYQSNLRQVGRVYREVMGANYPAMTLVQVVRLVEPDAKVEIEATAVIPES